jgi:NADP-dependent 3-hydroxy-3-methylglutaryl-CoA reductase
VLFFAGGKSYTGSIVDRSRGGLGLVTRDQVVDVRPGDVLSKLYVGRPEDPFSVDSLKVAYVEKNGYSGAGSGSPGEWRIGVQAVTAEQRKRLGEVLIRATGAGRPRPPGTFSPEKMPSFRGRHHYGPEAVQKRIEWAEETSGCRLEHVRDTCLDPASLAGNIEHYIGAVQIPVGLAGPGWIRGTHVDGHVPVPMATLEGALVSSATRGLRTCNLAGGVHVQVTRQTMVRAPAFFCRDLEGALNLEQWVRHNEEAISDVAVSVSSTARLLRVDTFVFGNVLHLAFYYATGDAAGQNMTTACTWLGCEWIASHISGDGSIGFEDYMIEANLSGDKKLNQQNFLKGRGISVVAEAIIPADVLRRVLRVTPERMVRCWAAGEVSALQIGMTGANVNFANVVAAVFAATGQDLASVHESGAGILKLSAEDGVLRAHAYLPSLVIGTVGGGTGLPAQQECLELIGCHGREKAFRLAEIIGATCLALDLSTLAAIATNEFAAAHEKLGRNRPDHALTKSEINDRFFTRLLSGGDAHVLSAVEDPLRKNRGIVSSILARRRAGLKGIFRYRLQIQSGSAVEETPMILKLKSPDTEIADIAQGLARLSGEDRLPGLFEVHFPVFGFDSCDVREVQFYRWAGGTLGRYLPRVYGTDYNEEREYSAILLEDLSSLSHFDTVDCPGAWDDPSIRVVLEGLSDIHAVHFDRGGAMAEELRMNVLDPTALIDARNMLRELALYNARRFPEIISPSISCRSLEFLEGAAQVYTEMQSHPMTLTHNDFNPRNICLRPTPSGASLVVYDWELLCYQNPQHDLMEFLIFVLDGAPRDVYLGYARYYYERLVEKTGKETPWKEFCRILYLNALDLALNRFNLYLLAHNTLKLPFIGRVYKNLARFIEEHDDPL